MEQRRDGAAGVLGLRTLVHATCGRKGPGCHDGGPDQGARGRHRTHRCGDRQRRWRSRQHGHLETEHAAG